MNKQTLILRDIILVYTQQSKTFDQPYEGTSHYVCIYDMRPRGYVNNLTEFFVVIL